MNSRLKQSLLYAVSLGAMTYGSLALVPSEASASGTECCFYSSDCSGSLICCTRVAGESECKAPPSDKAHYCKNSCY
jgi:hypothetical protein